jgi:ribosomal protein S18 acetylase RimI-like enzyme
MRDKRIIRTATVKDIPFLVETVINAEKSGTDILSYTTVFGLSEDETRKVLTAMFEEEIDGGELSVSSFMVAEIEGKVVSALSGWIECACGDTSYFLKRNLISYCMPKENIENSVKAKDILRDIYIEREPNTIQLEYFFTDPEYRNLGIFNQLLYVIIEKLYKENPDVQFIDVQVFEGNTACIKTLLKNGFGVQDRKESKNSDVGKYFPYQATKLLYRTNIVDFFLLK